ncbi:MAG: MFS transporter [Candidatus Binataceae bacterium]
MADGSATAPALSAPQAPPDDERRSVHLGLFGSSPAFTRRQWRVFLITTTAGFFDQYDLALLSLALKQIQQGLRIAEAQLGGVLSLIRLGYVCSMLLTPLADVFGRRRLLLYTVVGYTVFTGLTAIAPSAEAFVIFQFLGRAFAGAEATVALVILAEEVDAAVRGWSVGLMAAITSSGYGLAAIVFAFIFVVPYGWRGLYAIALVPLALIIPLRRALPESQRFEREKLAGLKPASVLQPIRSLWKSYPRRLLMMLAVVFLASLGGNASGLFLPKYLQEVHGWSPAQVSTLVFLGGALGILGSIIAGRLSDRWGRRRMGATFAMLAPILTVAMYSTYNFIVVPLWILHLFFDIAAGTIVRAYGTEMFPTSYRSTAGSAISIAGTTGGALGLFLEGVLYVLVGSHWTAIRMLTVFWIMAPLIVFWFFPETAGRELEEISPEAQPALTQAS